MNYNGSLSSRAKWARFVGCMHRKCMFKSVFQIKVCMIAGPEFKPLQDHALLINKVLYGLRTSALRWHERFSGFLRDMVCKMRKIKLDMWLRDDGEHYEHIAFCVDDLLIASKDLQKIVETLVSKYHFKLKGTGPMSYHLGYDFGWDEDGQLHFTPSKHIGNMKECYHSMFGLKPKQIWILPLEKGGHPGMDASNYMDQDGMKKWQLLVGAMQWAASLRG